MRRGASLLGAASLFFTSSVVAQVSGTLDLSWSDIRYDLFQPSTALALTPTIELDRGWTSLAARGTLLRFESGHRDLHGSIVGTTFTPAFGRFRVEAGLDAGASRYLTLPTFSHAFGAADLHYLTPRYGAWLGGTLGRTSFGGMGRGASTLGLGLWASKRWATLTLTASHSAIGDTSYTDLEGTSRVTQGPLELDGRLGARVGSRGGGHGVYGEASLTYALTHFFGLVIGGGRYPTDPSRGTIAGRYATIGVELGTRGESPVETYRDVLNRYSPAPAADNSNLVSLEVEGRVLRVRVDGASRVEVMGDFSDWQPVALSAAGAGTWEAVIVLAAGPHLVEVRIDGGSWRAPVGPTTVRDEFGGEAGLIVMP